MSRRVVEREGSHRKVEERSSFFPLRSVRSREGGGTGEKQLCSSS